jgi:hypothetical protein
LSEGEGDELEKRIGQHRDQDVGIASIGALMADGAHSEVALERPEPIFGPAEGHIEVALHSPRLPFGSIHTENLIPIFQTDGVYGINSGQVATTTSGSGSATTENSAFLVSTGPTIYSQGVLLGRKRLSYRQGQGIVVRFAASLSKPVAAAYQVAGFGHSEDGVYFGNVGTDFGILYTNRGVRETRTLTITTKSSTSENISISLNGTVNTIPVTTAAAGTLQQTVWEISKGTFTGWDAYPSGSTIVFVRKSAGPASGSYGITGTTVVGTFTQTKAGVNANESFIPQSSWNGDVLDGSSSSSNPSGVLLDPTKGNVYQIGIQYLGFGTLSFQIETIGDNKNNADFINAHIIKLPNTLSNTSFGNPSFPFTMAAYSSGSTSNVSVKVGSFAGFIEGNKILHGNRFSYFNQSHDQSE